MADRKRKGVSDKGGVEQIQQPVSQSLHRDSPTLEQRGPPKERAKAAHYELPVATLVPTSIPAPASTARYSPTPKGRYKEEAARLQAAAAAAAQAVKSSAVSQPSPTPPRSLGTTPPHTHSPHAHSPHAHSPHSNSPASVHRPDQSHSPVSQGRVQVQFSSRSGLQSKGAFVSVSASSRASSLAALRGSPVGSMDSGRGEALPQLHRTASLSSSLVPEGLTDQVASVMSSFQQQPQQQQQQQGSRVSALTVKMVNDASGRGHSPFLDLPSPEEVQASSLFQRSSGMYSGVPLITTSRYSPTPSAQGPRRDDQQGVTGQRGQYDGRRSPHHIPVSQVHPGLVASAQNAHSSLYMSHGSPSSQTGEHRMSPRPIGAERVVNLVPVTVLSNSTSLHQDLREGDRRGPGMPGVLPIRLHQLLTQTIPSPALVASTHSYSRPPGLRATAPSTTSTVTLTQLQAGAQLTQMAQNISHLSDGSYQIMRTSPGPVVSGGQRGAPVFITSSVVQRTSPVPVGKRSPAHRVSPVPGRGQSPGRRVSPAPTDRQSPAHHAVGGSVGRDSSPARHVSPGPTDRAGSPGPIRAPSRTPPPAHGRSTPDTVVLPKQSGVVDLSGKASKPGSQRERTPPPKSVSQHGVSSSCEERNVRRVSPVNYNNAMMGVHVGQPVVNLTRIPPEVAQQVTVKVERDFEPEREVGEGPVRNRQGLDFSRGPPPLDVPGSRPVFPTSLPPRVSTQKDASEAAAPSFNPKVNPFTFPTSALPLTSATSATSITAPTQSSALSGKGETDRPISALGPVKLEAQQGMLGDKENSEVGDGRKASCFQWNHVPGGTMPLVNPFNMRLQNLANFPTNTSMYRSAYRNQSVAVQRAKHCSVTSSAKSLDLLRQNLQKNLNQELDQVIQKYIEKFFKPAIANIKLNNGQNSVSEEHVHTVCRQILEEAKKVYQAEPRRSVTPVRDFADNTSEAGSTGRKSFNGTRRRRGSDSDIDSKIDHPIIKKKRKGRPPLHLSGRSTPSKTFKTNEPVKKEGPKWDPARLTEETQFVMGARANKALGLGATRGRLYIKHPYIFKYSGDADDKNWLYEHHLMPATRGKAYILVVEDMKDLFETEEYKDSPALLPEELRGFTVPLWMLQKMKQQMQAMRTDVGCNSKPPHSRSNTPNELPSTMSKQSAASTTSEDADLLSVTIKEEKANTPSSLSPFNTTGGFDEGGSPPVSDPETLEEEDEEESTDVLMPFSLSTK